MPYVNKNYIRAGKKSQSKKGRKAPISLAQTINLTTRAYIHDFKCGGMLMPYLEIVTKSGRIIEIKKIHSSRYGKKGIQRGENQTPTPLEMQQINEKNAEERLRQLINTNFSYKDIHLVLTYRRDCRPDPEQAKKDLEKFIRRLRSYFRKREEELRYISATEYKNKAIHHHLIIPAMDVRDLPDLWTHGQPRPTLLDDTGQYDKLAAYLIKETSKTFRDPATVMKKRWNSSKNLKQPIVKRRVINRHNWVKDPKPYAGYRIEEDKTVNSINDITGYPYQFYSMIKIEFEPNQNKSNLRERQRCQTKSKRISTAKARDT